MQTYDFRFEQMEIWRRACDVGGELCQIADELSKKQLYSFADQLRRAALSMSNNIAEGSGSESNKDFRNFLNYSRRSVFECASMMLFLSRRGYVNSGQSKQLLPKLCELSKMITGFKKSLSC